MLAKGQDDGQVVVVLFVRRHEQGEQIGEHGQPFLVGEHTAGHQLSEQTQVDAQLTRVERLRTQNAAAANLAASQAHSMFGMDHRIESFHSAF